MIDPKQAQGDDKLAKASDDDAIIAECIARYALSMSADADNRQMALDDRKFLKGDQWDEGIRAQRSRERRPCLTINRLPATLHQVTNSQRQNVPSIKVHPARGSTADTAEVVQGLIRHIEYSTNADVCYDTSVSDAAISGIGFFRLVTDYCADDSFDQEIKFRRIRNPFTVASDPASIEQDGSDQQWCVISDTMSRIDFRAEYPDADMSGFDAEGARRGDWVREDQVRVAEYYRVSRESATLVQLSNGEAGWKDKLLDLPTGVTVIAERTSTRRKVEWFKLTATEVLERAEIPCRWIPVFPVYGDEIDIDGKVYRSGVVRNAKDAARSYNFWITNATEEIALRPKTPYIGAEGQFEGHEAKWASANTTSFPYLEYKPVALGGIQAPPPQRQVAADFPAGLMAMAQHASEDIKVTTGIYDASLGARSNETSGVAISRRDKQGEIANYHYVDNLHTTLRHVGRCIVDMVPRVYDTQRVVRTMNDDKSVSTAEVNVPIPPHEQDADSGEVKNDLTVGEYDITIGVGPSYDTMRQEALDGMIELGGRWPKLMDVAGDKVVRAMDWPGAEEIAERLAKTLPPGLRDPEETEGEEQINTPQGPIPKSQVGSAMAQMQGQMQQMQQQWEAMQPELAKERIMADSRIRVAEISAAAKQDVEELKGFVQLLVAQNQQMKDAIAAMQQEALGRQDKPGSQEPPAARADETSALLAGIIQRMGGSKKRRMTIQAPSGASYVGEMQDVGDNNEDPGGMPPDQQPQPPAQG